MADEAAPTRLLIAVELVPDGGVLMAELTVGESRTLQLLSPVVDQSGKTYTALDITVSDPSPEGSGSSPDCDG